MEEDTTSGNAVGRDPGHIPGRRSTPFDNPEPVHVPGRGVAPFTPLKTFFQTVRRKTMFLSGEALSPPPLTPVKVVEG